MPPLKSQLRHLKKILLRRGATREDAEDLVQEAVLRLHVYARAGGQVRDQDAFVTRCALNLAVDAHRHARVALYERSPVEDLDLTDNGPTPDEVFEAEQRLVEMMQTLDRVSVRTRQVFFMHRLQGFSHAEIASKLDVSKSAVEKHIASAVTILAMERLAHGYSDQAASDRAVSDRAVSEGIPSGDEGTPSGGGDGLTQGPPGRKK